MNFSKMLLADFVEFSSKIPDVNLIFITATGVISGKQITEKDLENPETNISAVFSFCQDTAINYRKILQLSNDDTLPGDEGYIVLKDVSVQASDASIKMPFAVIFWKDIIGFSLGNLSRQ